MCKVNYSQTLLKLFFLCLPVMGYADQGYSDSYEDNHDYRWEDHNGRADDNLRSSQDRD